MLQFCINVIRSIFCNEDLKNLVIYRNFQGEYVEPSQIVQVASNFISTNLDKTAVDFNSSSPQLKRNEIIISRKWMLELPHELLNNLKLRTACHHHVTHAPHSGSTHHNRPNDEEPPA